MLVSIIIPVYNVEGFLERCLESVKNQTYKDTEVIIVNDGSTDSSPEIINRYVAENPNFKGFTIENSGLGGARNYGFSKATGDYVVFLDSDDYIANDCIEKFAKAAETENSDIVICNLCDVAEDGTPLSYYKNNFIGSTNVYDKPKILLNRFSAWGKMYKRELFGDLRFVAREWYEDLRMVPKLFLDAKIITYIDDMLFFYVQRAGSIMNNSNTLRNLEIITAIEDVADYFKQKGLYDRFKNELEFYVIDHIAVAAMARVATANSKEKKEVLNKLSSYISKFENLYNNKYVTTLSSNKKLVLFFNRNKLYFLTALCMKLKKMVK